MAERTSPALTVTTRSDRELVFTRTFDAPRKLVFEAHTTCEHMKGWWGPRRCEMAACEMDFRPGGKYRIVHRGADGEEFGFRGEFPEIVPPERIVWTFEFEGMPGHVSVQTVEFTEQDGKTTLTGTAAYDPVDDRDGQLRSGRVEGMAQTYDRLAEHLATMGISAGSRTRRRH